MNSGWCTSSFVDGTRPDKEVAPSEKWNLKDGWAPIAETFKKTRRVWKMCLFRVTRKSFQALLSLREVKIRIIFSGRDRNTKDNVWSVLFNEGQACFTKGQVRGKSSKLLKRLNAFPRIPNSIVKLFTGEYHEPRTKWGRQRWTFRRNYPILLFDYGSVSSRTRKLSEKYIYKEVRTRITCSISPLCFRCSLAWLEIMIPRRGTTDITHVRQLIFVSPKFWETTVSRAFVLSQPS